MKLNANRAREFVQKAWHMSVLPALANYVKIPAVSPAFDAEWKKHGHIDEAVKFVATWCSQRRSIPGLKVEIQEIEGRTPLIYIEVPGTGPEGTVLLYGHCDKQPPMEGWRDGLGPWTPVVDSDKLYGRGAADDGYAAFAALNAIELLHHQDIPYPRCVIIIEASEESGSPDLKAHLAQLKQRIGDVSLVVCLDSGCGDYNRLWTTTSLRGVVTGTLRVDVLTEGVHSGHGTGIVPSAFWLACKLLNRVSNFEHEGGMHKGLYVDIPANRRQEIHAAAAILGKTIAGDFPWAGTKMVPLSTSPVTQLMSKTWHPGLVVVGQNGLPPAGPAGNVHLPYVEFKISVRIPPTLDPNTAVAVLKELLLSKPPYGAVVKFEAHGNPGWNAPATAAWLAEAMKEGSEAFFGNPACSFGEGGTIPFMKDMGDEFPKAQFIATGVLSTDAHAHGPNEYLHTPTAMNVTGCVAEVIANHQVAA